MADSSNTDVKKLPFERAIGEGGVYLKTPMCPESNKDVSSTLVENTHLSIISSLLSRLATIV